MQRLWTFLALLCLGSTACATAVTGTPTPFPTEAAITPLPVANSQPIALTIAELLATPEVNENNLIQLTGQYHRRPKLVCEMDPYPSPATWELMSGEAVALAGGFDTELRRLLPDGLTMTVEGHWLHWQGPVGCGKRATVMEIWYLQVTRIVDPSPIARVTLTPFVPGVEIAVVTPGAGTVVSPQVGLTPTITITGTVMTATLPPAELPTPTLSGEQFPTATPEGEATAVPPTNTPPLEATPVLSPTNTLTPEETPANGTVTATLEGGALTQSPTPTPTFGPGTPTLTPDPNATATPTPDPNATATSTPTPGSGTNIAVKEDLEPESLNKDTLAANQIHAWPIALLGADEVVTVTATTADNANLILAIVDEENNTLIEVNESGVGGVETIGQFELSLPGSYLVHVKTAAGSPAGYALMLLFADSLNFIFKPVIAYGFEERNVVLAADSEHFWHFAGLEGEIILITVDPDDTTDVFLELYGPNADRISPGFISAGADGITEELEWELPEDGLYSIRVGEWNFASGTYTLTLED